MGEIWMFYGRWTKVNCSIRHSVFLDYSQYISRTNNHVAFNLSIHKNCIHRHLLNNLKLLDFKLNLPSFLRHSKPFSNLIDRVLKRFFESEKYVVWDLHRFINHSTVFLLRKLPVLHIDEIHSILNSKSGWLNVLLKIIRTDLPLSTRSSTLLRS